jgi:putative membrane protein
VPSIDDVRTDSTGKRHSISVNSNEAFAQYDTLKATESRSALSKSVSMWLRPFTRIHHVAVVKRVWLYMTLLALYTIAVDYFGGNLYPVKLIKEAGSAGAFGGIVLGLLLVFRTNSAYERWWEGRKLWGQLVNDSRNLSLKVRTLVDASAKEKTEFGELIISFSYALKHHLRGTSPVRPLPGVGYVLEGEHLPLHIASLIYDRIAEWKNNNKVDLYCFQLIDTHCRAFMDICGACERIKSSPIAVSYRAFMRQGITLNLLMWPWYFTQEYSVWWSLPPILIGAYFLVGIELIAEDVEEPFGRDDDDLPLDNICSKIRETVSSVLTVNDQRKFTTSIEKPHRDILRDGLH